MTKNLNKTTVAGLIIALGIIYGDIGTSPLYVMNSICNGRIIDSELILGALSCIIWTLTLQTTVKYVMLTLKADNKGEGGIFSLFALVRRHGKWTVIPAMVGGAALLADGMITPPISVTSAIEGLRNIPQLHDLGVMTIVYIVISILGVLFFFQQFGTSTIGKAFGNIMLLWFLMLGTLGLYQLYKVNDFNILRALNPYYAIRILTVYPKGFWILGGVFLCTTGAEALYSDLGHCGRANIRYSWIFVKTCLILNYLGQGAQMLALSSGQKWSSAVRNPFFDLMPHWFLLSGIIIATIAAIIASQALISGSFTLISEAIKLNLWPKMKINYPTVERGQLFIPGINLLLFLGCTAITLYFQRSSKMEAAYGLSITICMIMTSVLFSYYMFVKRVPIIWIASYLAVYLTIEFAFLYANLVEKFIEGGVVTIIVAGGLFMTMFIWFKSRKIKNRYVEFVRLENYVPVIQELSHDIGINKYATHLVYLTSANNPKEIEHKIIYSILYRKPKRADIYWFVHVDVLDDPYTMEYVVQTIVPNEIIRVEFRLGFRVEHKIQTMFKRVVEEMVQNKEVNIVSRYESLSRNNVMGDFRFIVMEKFLSRDNSLPLWERLMMRGYFLLKKVSLSEERGFGLDPSDVTLEKYPLIVSAVPDYNLKRMEE
ncbi:potassium transporter Kup [Flavipsychrobacter stenotrophus]|uniref:Potassium transporter Kup n=1 Tax=Flavipsychrobacter stenotrophus TaxID=2077091 RepID=A0A2S7SZ55_9BACT|nr:KUP/HAK/KT family potassium transporter [Flavipsychrobacter stenotrophus]PQJ12230.1 potassium transporter Kup [Flavipsychrobacter stenotrophus]